MAIGMPNARKPNRLTKKTTSSMFSPLFRFGRGVELAGGRADQPHDVPPGWMMIAAKAMTGSVPLMKAIFTSVATE